MLDELSPTQLAALGAHVQKWFHIRLSTAPIDRPKAKAAIELAYKLAGLKAPDQFIWCQSPLAMDLAYRMVDALPVKERINGKIRDEIYYNVIRIVKGQVWRRLLNSMSSNNVLHQSVTYTAVQNHDLTSIMDSILAGVSDSLWEAGLGDCWDRGQVPSQDPRVWCYGSHEATWLGFYDFFREECGMASETSKLEGLIAVAYECGWWIPCESMVFISSKPSKIEWAAVVTSGMIISYEDGFECR